MSDDGRVDLADFLLARIAEDEAAAQAAVCQCGGPVCNPQQGWMGRDELHLRLESGGATEHVLTWSPARVLVECAAKRRIMESAAPWAAYTGENNGMARIVQEMNLRLLALPFADHPDYDESWRP